VGRSNAEFEADALARPDEVKNPVDLGTILVPSGWLILGPGQTATLEVAAISRTRAIPLARLRVWFESNTDRVITLPLPLPKGERVRPSVRVPEAPRSGDRDRLVVTLDDGEGRELWRKTVPTMLVRDPPRWPTFGARTTRLRYDAPISVRDPKTGVYSSLPYEKGWDPQLEDVVVALPNGARFVFWRGSSYIPFWAGRQNTGACYEWAEMLSRPADAVDCVEPLMDKELRYGRVEIVETTAARVRVRWSYQSTDLHYHVWGDSAVEEYCFYPDGFGTRVLTLKSDPKNDYELSELIVLSPQDAYPLEILPENLVDALYLEGGKHSYRFPHEAKDEAPVNSPAVFRLRLHRSETHAAILFTPNLNGLPPLVFGPFRDHGQIVTPCYWGSHWPLARGNATGNAIDERIHLTPCHNSVMSWAGTKPAPLSVSEPMTIDALGRSRPMTVRRWVWLIGMSDEPDDRLLARALGYAKPPSIEARGARIGLDAYVPERRALRLRVEDREVAILLKPEPVCVNPVIELEGAPSAGVHVALGDTPVGPGRFAWDGLTLWLDATIDKPTELRITFE
jgi:hypothetical protein